MKRARVALMRERPPGGDGRKPNIAGRWLPADQPGEEEGFFRSGVERSDLRHLTWTGPDRGGEADLRQLLEPLLRLRQFVSVVGVERMTAVTGAVHHDLDCHDRPPQIADSQGPQPSIPPKSRIFKREHVIARCIASAISLE
jgi:hypothetical protein